MPDANGRLTLDEIFNKQNTPKRPSLEEIFGKPPPRITVGNNTAKPTVAQSKPQGNSILGGILGGGLLGGQNVRDEDILKSAGQAAAEATVKPVLGNVGTKMASDIVGKQNFQDFGVGELKSVPSTIAGTAKISPVQGMLKQGLGEQKYNQLPTSQAVETVREASEADNAAEEVGKTVGEMAQFALPGIGQETATAKAATFGQRALGVGKKALQEGLETGLITAAQEGEFNQDVATNAGLAAAFPLAGEAGKVITDPLKKYAGKVIPEKMIAKLIRPDKASYLFGKNPAKAVADEGIVASSFDDLVNKISGKKQEIGQKLVSHVENAVKANPNTVTNAEEILQKNADKFAKEVTDEGMWKTFSDRIAQLTGDFKADLKSGKLTKITDKDLSKMNAQQVWDLQKKVGELTQWTGNAYDKQVNQVLHNIYSDLGKKLDDMAPGAKELQGRWANMLGAEKSARARQAVVQRNSNIVSSGIGAGIAGTILPGDSVGEKARNAFFGAIIPGIKNHPRFRTNLANLLQKDLGMETKVANELVKAFIKAEISNSDNK